MTQNQIDLINKLVWFIPFKKFRNAIRNILNHILENQNRILENQNKILENQNKILENQSSNIKEVIIGLENNNRFNSDYFGFILKCQQLNDIKRKKILLVSHYLGITGAPMAVFNTAKELKNRGYYVVVISFDGGNIYDMYYNEGIDVFVSTKFMFPNDLLISYLKYFDFIFLNTVLSFNLANKIDNYNIPYLWRIAEAESIESKFSIEYKNISNILKKSKNIYAVSKYTLDFLSKYNSNINLLLYGINDISSNYNLNKNNDKITFVTIAIYEQPRKGHHVILEAIKLLPEEINKKIQFYFIGEFVPSSFPGYDNIYSLGLKLDNDKYSILAECDVLLHPALDDPNPQVVMEGMMMHKPCIVTDHVGQKDFIENGVDGFIVEAGNAEELAKLITNIVNDPSILKDMGEKSYLLYKKYFSFDNYINNVVSIIEQGIK